MGAREAGQHVPRSCGWSLREKPCEAEAWELTGRQAAAVREVDSSTPGLHEARCHEGQPAVFHTGKMTGSPPHSKGCSSSGVVHAEAGREATAVCGPGDRGGSKVAQQLLGSE